MDKRLTPEQLVKELRDIADGLKSDGYDGRWELREY